MVGQPITRDIPALTFRADVVPASVNKEKRTADVTWTTGARVLRQPWFDEPFLEELSLDPAHVDMSFLASGKAPVLDAHQRWGGMASQIGVVDSATLDGTRGTATLRFSQRDAVAPLWQDIQDQICRNVSFGYDVRKYLRIAPGAADGDPELPVYRAVDWTPYEISPVPIPADTDAEFRSGEPTRGAKHRCTLIYRTEESKMEPKPTPSVPPATPTPAEPAKVEDASRAIAEAATQAERQRGEQIRALVKRHGLDDQFAADLVAKGQTLEAARGAVLDKLAERGDSIRTEQHIKVGDESADKFVRGAAAWLLERSGKMPMVAGAVERKLPGFESGIERDPGEFRGMSLIELARESLRRRGINCRGWDKMRIAGAALEMTRDAGGLAGTSDFPVLLENVMYKILLGTYQTTPDTWSRVCKTDSVADFRPSNRYRQGSFSGLDALTENNEFQNKAIPDGEKHAISVITKGNIVAITRQAIVNDDMGAMADLAARFGRAARLQIEKDFYVLLGLNSGLGSTQTVDSQPFMHANRKNVNATGSALSAAGIDADRVVMAAQTDPSGNEILDLRPKILLVAVGLGGEARIINTSQYDPDVATSKFQRPNKVVGLFQDVVDTARLSGTRRYLFADPGIAAAYVVAFLEGQQMPFMEQQLGWRVDGVEWKVRLDYQVQEFDWRGVVTNAGA